MGRPMYEGEVRGRERERDKMAETRSQVKRETGKFYLQTVLT